MMDFDEHAKGPRSYLTAVHVMKEDAVVQYGTATALGIEDIKSNPAIL
jgi:hypothetical protein